MEDEDIINGRKKHPPQPPPPLTKHMSSYAVFNAVDVAVSKPVMGSDGAANWQDFRSSSSNIGDSKNNKRTMVSASSSSTAPTAPLKPADRAAGFTSWQEERASEEITRRETGDRAMHSGYQHFKEKKDQTTNESQRERRRILERRIKPHQQYFIPSTTFAGWKWDYVFTTRLPGRGTGYYFDGMDSVLELHGKRQRPSLVTTTTTVDIVSGDTVIGTKEANNNNKTTTTKTKKRKQPTAAATTTTEAVVIVRNPTHPLEQVAAAVQRHKMQQMQAQSQQSITSTLLPDGWEMAMDPTSKKPYYFHRPTGQRSWDRPNNSNSSNNAISTTATTATTTATTRTNTSNGDDNDNGCAWQEAKDASTGKTYYYNTKTNVTTWERPTGLL